jgi:haloalkane dehalogenase
VTDAEPRRPERPSWVPADLYPFEDRWLEIDGNLVHYVDEGEGPPLLLLNGNPSWSFGWRDVILAVRGSFRCVAPVDVAAAILGWWAEVGADQA